MKALIQRVSSASVAVDNQVVGEIGCGLLVLLGVEKNDSDALLDKMVHKLLNYRIFADENNKMNLSLVDVEGEVLVVSQFTLAATTDKGMRPGFSSAADPVMAEAYYERCIAKLRDTLPEVETGVFAANMQVALVNDGPVTFLLEC